MTDFPPGHPILSQPPLPSLATVSERIQRRLTSEYVEACAARDMTLAAALRAARLIVREEIRKASTTQTTVPVYDPSLHKIVSR